MRPLVCRAAGSLPVLSNPSLTDIDVSENNLSGARSRSSLEMRCLGDSCCNLYTITAVTRPECSVRASVPVLLRQTK
jgi:hypothetical protein